VSRRDDERVADILDAASEIGAVIELGRDAWDKDQPVLFQADERARGEPVSASFQLPVGQSFLPQLGGVRTSSSGAASISDDGRPDQVIAASRSCLRETSVTSSMPGFQVAAVPSTALKPSVPVPRASFMTWSAFSSDLGTERSCSKTNSGVSE
jgi:hypothetical protein